jgi:hypothetical protein
MHYLLNALPEAIVPSEGIRLDISPVNVRSGRALVEGLVDGSVASAIGHADTANIISALLGVEVPMARVSVPVLVPGDVHYLALYQGPRLPEGATALPEGATLSFYVLHAT